MKNREKYKDEIINRIKAGNLREFHDIHIRPLYNTPKDLNIGYLGTIFSLWLDDEYIEPEPDWSKVAVDTPILVSENGTDWERQHFAGYRHGVVYSFYDGGTSWTSEGDEVEWEYAKLAEAEECIDPYETSIDPEGAGPEGAGYE